MISIEFWDKEQDDQIIDIDMPCVPRMGEEVKLNLFDGSHRHIVVKVEYEPESDRIKVWLSRISR